jgi:hypothetical protein
LDIFRYCINGGRGGVEGHFAGRTARWFTHVGANTRQKKKKKKKKKKKNEKKPFFNFLKKKGNRNFASEFLFPSSSSSYHLLTSIHHKDHILVFKIKKSVLYCMSEEIARLMKTLRRIESECAEGGDELAEMGEGPLLESAPGVRGISFDMSCSAAIPYYIVCFIVEFTNSVWLLLFVFFFFSCSSCLFCHMSSSRRRRRRPLCLRRQRRCGGMPRRATDRRRPRLWSSAERLQTIPSQAETPIKRRK